MKLEGGNFEATKMNKDFAISDVSAFKHFL